MPGRIVEANSLAADTVAGATLTSNGILGDLNGDNAVDVDDMNIVINMMLGKADKTAEADLNNDGEVDVDDMNKIINIMLGKN